MKKEIHCCDTTQQKGNNMETSKGMLWGMMLRPFILLLILIWSAPVLIAQQVDIGIFYSGSDKLEVRIKPDQMIEAGTFITELRYTVRYPDNTSAGIHSLQTIPPFNIGFGNLLTEGGYKYQNFIRIAPILLNESIQAGEEVVVSLFSITGRANDFSLTADHVVLANNLEYYYEWEGAQADGIIYNDEPVAIPLKNLAILIGFIMMMGFVVVRHPK
jgi:hypothetical protein